MFFYLPLLFSVSALLICIFSFFCHNSYLKKRTGQKRILSEFEEEVNNILKSINEITERDITLIEEREKELKNLLNEIDKRLSVYIREMESREAAERSYEALGKKRHLIKEIVQEAESPAAEDTEDIVSPPPPFEEPPPVGEHIRSLARAGISAPLIASRLGISISEVEFATALLERRED